MSLNAHNTLWGSCYYSRPFFRWAKWGQSSGVILPRLATAVDGQSLHWNPDCLDKMTRLHGTEQGLSTFERMEVTAPLAISSHLPTSPPRETPTSLLPAVSYTHSHDSVKLSCFPARTLFLQGSEVLMLGGWGGWGKGVAGKKSVHKQLKDIRFFKNILLPPHGGLQILVEGRTDARRYSVAGM